MSAGAMSAAKSVPPQPLPQEVPMEATPAKSAPKKKPRGRPPKSQAKKQEKITDTMKVEKKPKRKIDRFKGTPESELLLRTLPDHLSPNLDIVIIGINPGLMAAYVGHHYPGPGNHFWKCIYMSRLIDRPMTAMDDFKLINYGIGFTNVVERTTPGSKDLSRKEMGEGAKILVGKLQKYQPRIAAFNGKSIYDAFSTVFFGKKLKKDFQFGQQPDLVPGTNTRIFVMPSSSARCAQFPRAQDKVQFYLRLKRLRNELKGIQEDREVEETDYSFDLIKAIEDAKRTKVKQEKNFDVDTCAGAHVHADPPAAGAAPGAAPGVAAAGTGDAPQPNWDNVFPPMDFVDHIPDITSQ
ncbi:G/T mismatch-specific thymine DNA glycosylase-like [Branchiostoma floridae]|uniref:G/T mismatch-specific thymine DNA glycosylase n=1 Tax=Branchiostoma floridae TaxID=7739 RepID=A0A9J7KDM8_BRAFL|nr:G/T mismatch-specific thymine DNA glycosylase-like [Branchiostoma floridae]